MSKKTKTETDMFLSQLMGYNPGTASMARKMIRQNDDSLIHNLSYFQTTSEKLNYLYRLSGNRPAFLQAECAFKIIEDGGHLDKYKRFTSEGLSPLRTKYLNDRKFFRLYGQKLSGNFGNWDFSYSEMSMCELAGDFKFCSFVGTRLNGVDFNNCDIHGSDFSHTKLSGANFTLTKISGINFTGADLSGAKFAEGKELAKLVQFGRFEDSNRLVTVLFYTDGDVDIIAGCFHGSLEKFVKRVKSETCGRP
jgi:uncharacterized protein YjbI with pentapeptide repeats